MRLASLKIARSMTTRLADRVGGSLLAREELLRRGREAVASATDAVLEAAPMVETRPARRNAGRRVALAAGAVAVTAVAVGAAYLWWRHNRDKEYAWLQPEPERPDLTPAAPAESPQEPEAPSDEIPPAPVDEEHDEPPERATERPAEVPVEAPVHKPEEAPAEEPAERPIERPVASVEPAAAQARPRPTVAVDLDAGAAERYAERRRTTFAGLPAEPPCAVPGTRIDLPADRVQLPRLP